MKKTFIKISLILSSIILFYFIYMFIGGGFGKKPISIDFFQQPDSTTLFAHRGYATEHPENSEAAIENAYKRGFKAVEIDLRKSADNHFILFHDYDCSRLLGFEANIQNLSLEEIKKHYLLSNGKTTEFKVITLEEMLNKYAGKFVIYFDMKLNSFNEADEIVQIIKNKGIIRNSIIASANALFILYIEFHYPEISTALEGFNRNKEWLYYAIPKNLKPDFLSSFAEEINENHFRWLQENNLITSRIVYGVDKTNYEKIINFGIKNIIIDYEEEMNILPTTNKK